jgi:hypothetical protein
MTCINTVHHILLHVNYNCLGCMLKPPFRITDPGAGKLAYANFFTPLQIARPATVFRQTLEHLSPKFLGSWRMTGNPLHFRPVRYMPMQPGIVRHLLRIAANKQTLEQLIGS